MRLKFNSVPKADVAVLESESGPWPEIKEISAQFTQFELPTNQPRYQVQTLSATVYLALRNGIRPGLAQLGPLCQRAQVRTLIATDGGHREHIAALSRVLPSLSQILISHGSVRVDNIVSARFVPNMDNQTLVAWGNADVDTYKKVGIKSPRLVVAGSLRNSCYWALHRSGRSSPRKEYPISLVSNFADHKEESSTKPIRSRVLRLMKSNLARYCRERHLPIRILLRPGLSGQMLPGATEREMRHFKEIFADVPISYSDISRRYATYIDSDLSDVTIGVPSGSLTESFARGNKVLMCGQNSSEGDFLGFPKEGLYLLNEPGYELFAERLDLIRSMSCSSFAMKFQADREYLVANATSDRTLSEIRNLIREQICRP